MTHWTDHVTELRIVQPAKCVFIENFGDGLKPWVGTLAPNRNADMFDVWINGQLRTISKANKPYFVQADDPAYPTLEEGPLP